MPSDYTRVTGQAHTTEREWQTGTSVELPRTSRSTTLSRSLTPLQCLMGAAPASPRPPAATTLRPTCCPSAGRPDRAAVKAKRSGAVERGRQADGLARCRFEEFPDRDPVPACCLERAAGWDRRTWASIIAQGIINMNGALLTVWPAAYDE
jgi:hypothetical protein